MWSGEQFLDYDSYKSGISSVSDKIWDKIDLSDDEEDNLELDDIDVRDSKEDEDLGNYTENNVEEIDEDVSQDVDKRAIKAFPRSVRFVNFSQLSDENTSKVEWNVAWYSKSDLLLVISKYIEENLDDDTDILVTVEYEDGSKKPQKIILETRPRTLWEKQSIYFSSRLSDDYSMETEWKNGEVSEDSANEVGQKNNVKSVQRNKSNNLTQKEQKEAEEIFSILF